MVVSESVFICEWTSSWKQGTTTYVAQLLFGLRSWIKRSSYVSLFFAVSSNCLCLLQAWNREDILAVNTYFAFRFNETAGESIGRSLDCMVGLSVEQTNVPSDKSENWSTNSPCCCTTGFETQGSSKLWPRTCDNTFLFRSVSVHGCVV